MDLEMAFASNRQAMTEGMVSMTPLPMPTRQELCFTAVYDLLNKEAKAHDYPMGITETFLMSGDKEFGSEAAAFKLWYQAVWAMYYELIKEPIESVEGFVAQLPKFVSKAD